MITVSMLFIFLCFCIFVTLSVMLIFRSKNKIKNLFEKYNRDSTDLGLSNYLTIYKELKVKAQERILPEEDAEAFDALNRVLKMVLLNTMTAIVVCVIFMRLFYIG